MTLVSRLSLGAALVSGALIAGPAVAENQTRGGTVFAPWTGPYFYNDTGAYAFGDSADDAEEAGETEIAQRRRPGSGDDGNSGDGIRRRPVDDQPFDVPPPIDPSAVEIPDVNVPQDFLPVPDRWRIVEAIGVNERWWDPYNQNTLKGDRPLFDDWFVNILAVSDTVLEPRYFPVPRPPSGTLKPGTLDVFSEGEGFVFNQNFIFSVSFIKGDTAYKPPDYEIRFTPVINYNYVEASEDRVLHINPVNGDERHDSHIALQEAFLDYHIRNVSDRYDFDSIRVGIQPISADFRSFLFSDSQLGIRLFGSRNNNKIQYNIAWFERMEKDTNSGLNTTDEEIRDDSVYMVNVYLQDLPSLGHTTQFTAVYNVNREDKKFFYNDNGFLERPASMGFERPRKYDVLYLGVNGDGHFGRLNLTSTFYYATGTNENNPFTSRESDIDAYFLALEPSIDYSYIRLRGSFLYASGDDDPFDNEENGFDTIFENPQFAGADTSYWIRQTIPLIGGGGVVLSTRNGILPSLRSSKEHGQSNFSNPGMWLIGFGTDFDLTPEFRLSTNVNWMAFDDTSSLEFLRNQGGIDEEIGWDASVATIWRPLFTQNVVVRLSGAFLIPEDGFKQLYTAERSEDVFYSVLGNLILTY